MTNVFPKTYHALASGLTVTLGEWNEAKVLYRGQEFTVTAEQYEFTKDKLGRSWLDLTPEEQEARWGKQQFAEGPTPEGMAIGSDDTHGYEHRRWMRAVEQAKLISNPSERAAEFARIKKEFPGNYGSAQRTLRQY